VLAALALAPGYHLPRLRRFGTLAHLARLRRFGTLAHLARLRRFGTLAHLARLRRFGTPAHLARLRRFGTLSAPGLKQPGLELANSITMWWKCERRSLQQERAIAIYECGT
jgi:hypothetical protein